MSYGNGYQEDHYSRLDNTKPINAKDPFISEGGPHQLAVISMEEFRHQTHGASVRVSFVVESSPVHTAGSRVTKLFFLQKPSKFPGQTTDSDRFADFVRVLKGAPVGTPMGKDCREILRDRAADNLPRGMRVTAFGINTSKNPAKPWVEPQWSPVQQTPEQIAQMRARIESTPGLIVQYGPQAQQYQAAPPAAAAPAPVAQAPAQVPAAGWGAAPAAGAGFSAQIPPANKPPGAW